MHNPTVSAAYAAALLNLAVSKGADRERLLLRAEIDADSLSEPDQRIEFVRFKALMRAGKEQTGEPALALHFGAMVKFQDLSIVGLIAHAATTMPEAFMQMNRYHRLVVEVEGVGAHDRFKLVERGEELWIEDTRKNPNEFPELTESTLGRFICSYNRNFKELDLAKQALVTHQRPDYADEYERILECPVEFGADKNAIFIDRAWLSLQLWPAPRYVFGVLSKHAEQLLDDLNASRTLRSEVESLILPILHTGPIRMQEIANQLSVSRQTLYRKLKSEGTSFENILDELRHRMAQHYLSGKKVSVNEAAYLVGFSDPSSFSRAFKRWTGHYPSRLKRDSEN